MFYLVTLPFLAGGIGLLATTLHEAGDAVAAVLLGMKFLWIRIGVGEALRSEDAGRK